MDSFYSEEELQKIRFKSIWKDVLLSKKASFYGAQNIYIGNHVRIDDFYVISGNVEIRSFIHISAYTGMFGGKTGIISRYTGCQSQYWETRNHWDEVYRAA